MPKEKIEEEETEQQKHPIEMTTDELLDYAIAPELAMRLREIAHEGEESEEDSEDEKC